MGFSAFNRATTLALGALLLGACSSDWDLLDPRVDGASGSGASTASGGETGSGGSGAMASGGSGAAGNGGAATGGSASGGAGAGVVGGMGGSGGLPPGTLTVVASVADCVDTVIPDPDVCEATVGVGSMRSDNLVNATGNPAYSFVRFDVDGTIAGRTVTSVLLRLTVSDLADANSAQSGDIWEVETFNRQGLFNAVPAQIGAAPWVPSIGAVVQNQLVEVSLPNDSVAANEPTTLGIFTAISDGVFYFNLNGAVPPELVIDYE